MSEPRAQPGRAAVHWCSRVLLILTLLFGLGSREALAFDVEASSAILMDARTGQVLFEKDADAALPPASLTKIVTLLVVMDAVKDGRVSLDDEVRTSQRASATGGSQVWLAEGETHSLRDMLKAIAIASANDASVAVAEFIAGTEAAFAGLMTERAQELGMTESVFYNSDGLPPGEGEEPTLSSARDMAIAARTLIQNHPEVLDWTSTVMETFRQEPLFILYNTNRLVSSYDGLDGLKTGHTNAAGWCLVATANRGDVRLISVVMGTESQNARDEQTRRLLDHGFGAFVPTVAGEGVVGEIRVPTGTPERIDVELAEPATLLAPRGVNADIQGRIETPENLEAPLAAGDDVGEYVVSLDGDEVLRVPLLASEEVERANLFVRAWRSIRDFVTGLFTSNG